MKKSPGESSGYENQEEQSKQAIDFDVKNIYSILGIISAREKHDSKSYLTSIKEAVDGGGRDSGPIRPKEVIRSLKEILDGIERKKRSLHLELMELRKQKEQIESYLSKYLPE